MKIKNLILSAVAGTVMLASCSNSLNEKLKADMASFESAWKSSVESLSVLSGKITATSEGMAKECATNLETVPPNLEGQVKTQMDSLLNVETGITKSVEALKAEIATATEELAGVETAYNEWKVKMEKGEIKGDDAINGFNEYQTKLNNYTTKITEWETALSNLENACKTNCEGIKTLTASVPAKPAKK